MNPFELEESLQSYYKCRQKGYLPSTLLFQLMEFIDLLFLQENENAREAYIIEISRELENLLDLYSPFGIEANKTKHLLQQIKKLNHNSIGIKLHDKAIRIEDELNQQNSTLNGKKTTANTNPLSFPVLQRNKDQHITYGTIEHCKITIISQKHIKRTEFIIAPSLPEVEQKLETQIQNSWTCATHYFKTKFNKNIPQFEVTIRFVRKLGIYEGDSLGIVLTIEFIKELYRHFELRDSIYFDKNIIATGSLSPTGIIDSVGDSIIISKIRIAFYSLADVFIIPLEDLAPAKKELEKLNAIHPYRKLKLLPVIDINDIINRRDLICIKKQNIIKWGGNRIIKNKAILALLLLFSITFISYYYFNLDKNPSKLELVDGRYLIKNKQDKVLWYKETHLGENYSKNKSALWNKYRFYDVDNDGLNEVLMVHLKDSPNLFLFDDDGKMLWSFKYSDTLETREEKFTGHFISYGIIDTVHSNSKVELLIYFQHNTHYPCGIAKLNLMTGEKIGNVLWHPGSITGAILIDWNNDGKKEIIAGGPSNGKNRSYLFSINHDKLNGTFPTSENYMFLNMKLSDMNKYLLFPKTDYAELFFPKYNAPTEAPTIMEENVISIGIGEGSASAIDADFGYQVRLDRNLDPINCVVGDGPAIIRDRLVKQGKLNPPYTDSKEFLDLIMKNIEYWDGQKFVKYR